MLGYGVPHTPVPKEKTREGFKILDRWWGVNGSDDKFHNL